MDREYTEFVDGVSFVIAVEQQALDSWRAHSTYRAKHVEARAETAERARAALIEALRLELRRTAPNDGFKNPAPRPS